MAKGLQTENVNTLRYFMHLFLQSSCRALVSSIEPVAELKFLIIVSNSR